MSDLNKEIELLEAVEEAQEEAIQLPLNFLTFGELDTDDVKVYIRQSTYKALEKLAQSDTEKELGSILLGSYSQEQGKIHVVISAYIEAKYTDASASTLTFTHETWDFIHKEHARKYPELKIIGWQHTHPNYGIFLSNYDMFIQENFFNLPFQVAYVIDPVQNLRGFFQWKKGKVEKLKGYNIYDEVGKPIKIPQTKQIKEKKAPVAKTSPVTGILLALLVVICALLSFHTFSLQKQLDVQLQNQKLLTDTINAQSSQLAAQNRMITQLQGQLDQAPQDTTPDNMVCFVEYTVVKGDTLKGICDAHGIDYRANLRLILAINGISDANKLYAGQVLLLPVAGKR